VKLGYEALNLSTKPAARDAVLADIAAGLSELGMIESARDAHLILANTSQMEWVRWQATINLMELAGRDGAEDAFESYAAQLSETKLSPAHKAYFLMFRGEGLAAFGKHGEAEEYLRAAVSFAAENQLHQVAFEADAALSRLQTEARREKASRAPATWSEDLSHVVTGLSQLREAAFAAPAK
jgi:hypothetical protein